MLGFLFQTASKNALPNFLWAGTSNKLNLFVAQILTPALHGTAQNLNK